MSLPLSLLKAVPSSEVARSTALPGLDLPAGHPHRLEGEAAFPRSRWPHTSPARLHTSTLDLTIYRAYRQGGL